MLVRASSTAAAAGPAGGGNGGAASFANRVRSASPARRALALDMRHIANLLREPHAQQPAPAATGLGEGSVNTSMCSSPHTNAWEPGDRGAAPVRVARSPVAPRGTALHNQFSAVAEKVNVVIGGLQRQCDMDRKRLAQLERKVDARLEDRAREGDGRVNMAEIQGSVNGLIEETQGLTRRMETLDERLWARTSGSEIAKQRSRELEQQVQALEQQSRLALAAAEETQKRQATKLRRAEHAIEDLTRRLQKLDDDARLRPAAVDVASQQQRDSYFEERIGAVEQQHEQLDAEIRALQMHVEENLQGIQDAAQDDADGEGERGVEDSIQNVTRHVESIEKKVMGDVEELRTSLASMRVKVDGQLQRIGTLAERMETAHEPAIEALRGEVMQGHTQHRRDTDSELSKLRNHIQEHGDNHEETASELREAIQQARAEIAALSLRPVDNRGLRSLEDRLTMHEREVSDLRSCFEQLPPPLPQLSEEDAPRVDGDAEEEPGVDLQDLRRRLEWLEEQGSVGAASEKADAAQVAKMQNTVCDLVGQMSRLSHTSATGDSKLSAIEQQVQQMQLSFERRGTDAVQARGSPDFEAKVGAIAQQVADLSARVLEVEGGLEFARESTELATPADTSSKPVLRSGAGSDGDGAFANAAGGLQEKLVAIAEHLEIVDDLAERVAELERLPAGGEANIGGGGYSLTSSQNSRSEVGAGEGAAVKGDAASPQALDGVSQEVGELRERLSNAESKVKTLQAGLSKQELLGQELERGFKAEIASLKGVVDTVEALEGRVQESAQAGREVAQLRAQVKELSERAPTAEPPKQAPELQQSLAEMGEMKQQVRELSEKLGAAQKSVVALESAKSGSTTASDASADFERLRETSEKAKVDAGSASEAAAAALNTAQELEERLAKELAGLEERVAAAAADGKGHASTQVGALEKRLDERLSDLPKHREELTSVRSALEALSGRHTTLAERHDALLERHDALSERVPAPSDISLTALHQKVEELSKERMMKPPDAPQVRGEGTMGGDAEELQRRLGAVEERLAAQGADGGDAPRAQVQESVEDLTAQIAQEIGSLTEHQRELVETKETVDALAEKVAEEERATKAVEASQKELVQRLEASQKEMALQIETTQKELVQRLEAGARDSMSAQAQKQLEELRQRISAAEDTVGVVRKDVEALAPRKVGISPGGNANAIPPLEALSARLEELAAQVAEVRECRRPEQGPRADEPANETFDFSITEQTDRLHRPGGGDDSLNFSLTKDLSFSEPASRGVRGGHGGALDTGAAGTSASIGLPRQSDPSTELDEAAGSGVSTPTSAAADKDEQAAATEARLGAGQPRDIAGGDVLDGLVTKGGGDVLDGAKSEKTVAIPGAGTGAGTPNGTNLVGRPRPPALGDERLLAPVAEEESIDAGEPALETPASCRGTSKSAKATSPLPGEPSPGSALETSQSGLEVSMAPDYSVEDSLELEKCDHVEEVQPSTPELRRTPKGGSPAASNPSASPEGKKSPGDLAAKLRGNAMAVDALDSLLGPRKSSSESANPVSPAAAPKPKGTSASPAKKDEEEGDYGHESFEDDMSVQESIGESLEDSGSQFSDDA